MVEVQSKKISNPYVFFCWGGLLMGAALGAKVANVLAKKMGL